MTSRRKDLVISRDERRALVPGKRKSQAAGGICQSHFLPYSRQRAKQERASKKMGSHSMTMAPGKCPSQEMIRSGQDAAAHA